MSILTRVDHILWKPANAVGRALSAVARFRTSSPRPLLVRPGGLGDLVVATAAVESLGLAPTDFDWLIEKRSAPWAAQLNLAHVCYDQWNPGLWAEAAGIRRTCVILEQRYGLASAFAEATLARDGVTFGFSTNRAAGSFHGVTPYDAFEQHELLAFQTLLSDAFRLQPQPIAARRRKEPPGGANLVAIAGSGVASREFDVSDWILMITRFVDPGPFTLTCAPHDIPLAKRVLEAFNSRCELSAGTWSATCEQVKRARRVFTVDGGMAHVASYYGVPVDAVFTSGRAAKWHPWSAGSRVIKSVDLSCQPCTKFGAVPNCEWNYRCKEKERWQVSQCDL